MSILDPRLWLVAIVGLTLAFGGGRLVQSRADAKKYEAERTKAALSAAVDQGKAVDRARAEEQRRGAAQTEIANVAKQEADTARSDARAADAAAERLRQRVDQLLAAARAVKDPGSAGGGQGQPGGDPLDVLVDVLGRSDKTSGILADYADQLKVAGLACERSYEALTPSTR
ncbi:hypothetical protein D769_25096 [Cupriavidus sp. HMR-1]|uniref:DUF2514 family protein n=1 Tax=Cupriavidus sp. HMR-1 TaxID=1249621 RepID=UPI0002A266DC|nr:DUF2514 family protein [Cupriavidus sp. HMR-1]EKZ96480.1 hypothetical protein D769_25096 [Cupriavidus sp. HMR-1]